jgi:predicted lipid carrier protein YhbT
LAVQATPVPVPVRLAEGAGSGLAHIVQQLLEQDQAEYEGKRRRAARLRGRVVMTASDFDASVTLDFRGDAILVFDGRCEPVDASITGPQRTLVRLLQGEANPLMEHLRGRLRVRSRLRRLFFPLRLHGLMKLREGSHGGR